MSLFTASSQRLLDSLMGHTPNVRTVSQGMPSHGPTATKVRDRVGDVEDAIARMEGMPGDRFQSDWLLRQRGVEPRTGRRRCCTALLRSLDGVLHRLPVESEHECPVCGAVWNVGYRPREERFHG